MTTVLAPKPSPYIVRSGKPQVAQDCCFIHWTGVADIKPTDPNFDSKIRARLKSYAKGRPDVPGPLYHAVIDSRGQLWILAEDHVKCNHGGRISPKAWAEIERGQAPADRAGFKAPAVTIGRNSRSYSIALEWSGKPSALTPAASAALVSALANWCSARGRPADLVVDHRLMAWWRKVDVSTVLDLGRIRHAVAKVQNGEMSYLDHDLRGSWTPDRPLLKLGVESSWVVSLRRFLMSNGYRSAVTTGDPRRFGAAMKRAVTQYQKDRGLGADGIVGAKTWARVIRDSEAAKVSAPKPRNPKTAAKVAKVHASKPPLATSLSQIPNGTLLAELGRRLNKK